MGIGRGDVDKPFEWAWAWAWSWASAWAWVWASVGAWAWATAEIQKRRSWVAENYQERGKGKIDNGGCKANLHGESGVAEILREKVE